MIAGLIPTYLVNTDVGSLIDRAVYTTLKTSAQLTTLVLIGAPISQEMLAAH